MTGVFDFDPDQFVRPAHSAAQPEPAVALFATPPAWAHGLDLLRDRDRPAAATAERWAQVIADSTRLATIYAQLAIDAGWSVENLFGFVPGGMTGEWGLAITLRGRRLVGFDGTDAVIRKHVGPLIDDRKEWVRHRPILQSGAPLLWNFVEVDR